jgi:integrase/recombinase XerD
MAVLDRSLAPLESALAEPTTPDEVAAAWLLGYSGSTREAYTRDLREWAGWLAQLGVEPFAARRLHVDAYVRQLEEHGLSRQTIARRLSSLSGYYRYAIGEGLIVRSPVANVRRPKLADESPTLGLDRDELVRFLKAARSSSARDHALSCLLALNGLRVSEALGADACDLGTERGHRTLAVVRKGGRRALVPLAPRTAEALDTYLAGRGEGPLFVTSSGKRLDRFAAAKTIRSLARRAGIEKSLSPHSLRHTFVTQALDAGASLRDVQDAAGHADPRTTRRYDRGRHNLDRHPTYAVAASVG